MVLVQIRNKQGLLIRRQCADCKLIKPISEFRLRSDKKIYKSMCQRCLSDRARVWQERHKEKYHKYGANYRKKKKMAQLTHRAIPTFI